MLKRIKIDRFKCVSEFDEELPQVTVLVGVNNSGKTSVLHAVHSAVAIAQSRLRLADQSSMNSDEAGFSISVADTFYLPLVDANWLAPNGRLTQSHGPKISFIFDDATASEGTIEILRGRNRNLSVEVRGREVIARIEKLNEPFTVFVPGLAGIARNESFIARGNLLRAIARGDANLVLRNVLWLLKLDPEKWRLFSDALREVFAEHYITIRFTPDADEYIQVAVKIGAREIPFDCIGTGFLQTTQILSYIYLFSPAVTLLDEPDSHLHPDNQRLLAGLLCRLASEGRTKIMLATHSRHILDAMREREGVVVKWLRAGKVQAAPEHVNLLMDLGALDSAEGLLMHGVDFVILTEDANKTMLRLLLEANGAINGRYQLWAYKGCSRIDIAEALGKFIHEVSPQTKILVHRDSDFMDDTDKTYWRQSFLRYGLDLFLPPTPDIEGLFSRLSHLLLANPQNQQAVQTAWHTALAAETGTLRQSANKGRKVIDDIRHKKGEPTQGTAAIEAWSTTLDVTDERWRHGKLFLAKIRELFQQAMRVNIKTDVMSPGLEVPELKAWIVASQPPQNP
jgi:hypothetical protein